jgi:hypothetical protein
VAEELPTAEFDLPVAKFDKPSGDLPLAKFDQAAQAPETQGPLQAPINLLAPPQPLDLSYLTQGQTGPGPAQIAPSLAKFVPGTVASTAQERLYGMRPQSYEDIYEMHKPETLLAADAFRENMGRNANLLMTPEVQDLVDNWHPNSALGGGVKGLAEVAKSVGNPENVALLLLLREAPPEVTMAAGAVFRGQMLQHGAQAGLDAAQAFMLDRIPLAAQRAVEAAASFTLAAAPEGKARASKVNDEAIALGDRLAVSVGDANAPKVVTPTEVLPGTASMAMKEKAEILGRRPPQPLPTGPVVTPNGDLVNPNAQATPLIEALVKHNVEELGGNPEDPQSTADVIADARGIRRPEVRVADVPVSQTETTKDGRAITTVPPEATVAAVVHEMAHQTADQGKGPEPDEGTQDSTALQLLNEPIPDRGLVLADKLTPGMYEFVTGQKRGQELVEQHQRVEGPPPYVPEQDPYRFEAGGRQYQTDWGGGRVPPEGSEPQFDFADKLGRTLKYIATTIWDPRYWANGKGLDIVGKMMGARTRQEVFSAINTTISEMEKKYDTLPTREQDMDWDRVGRGEKSQYPWLNQVDSFMKTLEDNQLAEINKQLSPEGRIFARENHVGARWRAGPEGDFYVQEPFGAPRPLAGSGQFTKRASGLPFTALKDMGYIPAYQNRVTAWKARMMEKVAFDSTLRAIRDGLDNGLVMEGRDTPPGFSPLDDKLYTIKRFLNLAPEPFKYPAQEVAVRGQEYVQPGQYLPPDRAASVSGGPPPTTPGEPPIRGKLFAEDSFARILNNIVSYDQIRSNPALGPLLTAKFISTGWELSLAAPHAWHVGGVLAPMMHIGNALAAAWNGGLRGEGVGESVKARAQATAEGLKDAIMGIVPTYPSLRYGQMGNKLVQIVANKDEFLQTSGGQEFLKKYPQADRFINALLEGGQKVFWDETKSADMVRQMKEYWESDENGRMLVSSLGVATDSLGRLALTNALFRSIRAQKFGAAFETFGGLVRDHAEDLAAGRVSESELARRSVDYSDNIMGQVDYARTWYMNRTARSLLQFAFRAPAFTMGFAKFVGSALHGQWMEIKDIHDYINGVKEGEPPGGYIPRLDPRFAGLMAMMIPWSFAAAGYQMYKTGQPPDEPLDLFYPKNGTIDANGNPGRTAIFGLPKEIYNWTRGGAALAFEGDVKPLWGTFTNKMAGWIGHFSQISNNRDFYNTRIWEPNDPGYKRIMLGIVHAIGGPIQLAAMKEAAARGMAPEDLVLTALGWRPAPLGLKNTPLDDYVGDVLRGKGPMAGMSQGQRDQRVQMNKWAEGYRSAKDESTKANIYNEMVDAGVSSAAIGRLLANAMAPDQKQARYARMNWDELSGAWDLATPEERFKIRPIFLEKLANAKPEQSNFPTDTQQRWNRAMAKVTPQQQAAPPQ